MKTRGEKRYINLPLVAAKLYDNLTDIKGVHQAFEEIAIFLNRFLKQGKLLDIGTGPGRLLYEIHKQNKQVELYGIDISEAMLTVARRNLRNVKSSDLRSGNIIKTDYPTEFFDCIVSTGSFYNWDKPIQGLHEIFRILKTGKTAYIFETYKNYNKSLFKSRLKDNLKGYNMARKILLKYFLKKQLSMTYFLEEFDDILKLSDFKNSYTFEKVDLGNLPIYVRLELRKP